VSAADAAIAARIRAELADLQRVVKRVEGLTRKAVERDDADYYDGVALNLHAFYVGVERVLQMIVREIDGAEPQGGEWHREILSQCAAAVTDTRPAVLHMPTRDALDEFRAFRHVVRNVYAFSLRPDRLRGLAAALPSCFALLSADLGEFAEFLESIDTGPGAPASAD